MVGRVSLSLGPLWGRRRSMVGEVTEVTRSCLVWLATWKGCSPWPSHPFPLGTLCHPDRPLFPGLSQHFAPSPGFLLHTKPTAARGGAGCSALLNINATHLSRRVRRRARNRRGRSPQPGRPDHKNTVSFQHWQRAPCADPSGPELCEQPQQAFCSLPCPLQISCSELRPKERKQKSNCSHSESAGRASPAWGNSGATDSRFPS